MNQQIRFVGAAALVLTIGCSQQSTPPATGAKVVATPVAFNIAGKPTIELSVPGMMCEDSCAVKVKEVLAEQPGAADVKVDFPAKKALVAVDSDKFDVDAAIAALADYGFDDTKLVSDGEADDAKSDDAKSEEKNGEVKAEDSKDEEAGALAAPAPSERTTPAESADADKPTASGEHAPPVDEDAAAPPAG